MRREDLVHHLGRRLGALSTKRGGVALALWGDPGVGKSWVASQVLRALPLRSAEVPASADPAAVVRTLLRPARLPTWTEEALRRLNQGEPVSPEATADALNSLLSELAPFVLLVGDLHEAPAEQQALWQAVAAGATRSRGVAVLTTTRQVPPAPFESQALEPLSDEDTAGMLSQTLGAALPGEAARWIGQHALGNPLFSVEYLRFLIRQGCLWNDGQRWHWRPPREKRIPTSVEALISHLSHTPALSPAAQAALQARALLPGAPAALWAQVAGLGAAQLQQASEELERRGILRGGQFVHPLYREVEAQHLAPGVRRAVARRAVEALTDSDLEAAAAFVEDAGLAPEQALPLLRGAADAAQAQGRPRRAAEFLSGAAGHAAGPERTALALAAARLWRDQEPRRVIALAEQVLEAEPQHLEAAFLLAGALAQQGEEERASRLIRSLQGAARAEPNWLFGWLTLHAERNDYVGVLELWQAHEALHPLAPPAVLAQVVRALDFCGQPDAAIALASQTLAQSRLSGAERSALLFARCRARYNAGEVTAAEADAAAMVTLAQQEQRLHELARGLSTRATIRDTLGRYPEALADAQASLAIFGQLGVARDYAQQQSRLACLLLEYGDYEQAETLLHEGHEVMKRAGVSHFLALCEHNLAYLYLEQNPPFGGALALKYAHAGLQHARQAGSPLIVAQTAAVAARAEAVHGSPEQALALGDEALALMRQIGSSHDAAWAIWARGFALEASGRRPEALAAFESAAAELEERGLTLWANRLGLEADRLAGNLAAARHKLAFFQQHGLQNWVNVTQRYFPALAGDPSPVPAAEVPVFLGVLGPVQLHRGGQVLRYRGQKGKELLAYLLEARLAGQAEVRQLELQEALYGELPDAAAASALQQLVYRLRQVLGAEAIQRTDTGYRLGAAESDAEAFLSTGDPRLWRGPYLADLGAGWDASAEEALYHALERRAQALLEIDPRETARLGRILLDHDPYDQGRLSLSLRALQASGNRRGVQKLYQESGQRLQEVGEAPAPLPELLASPPTLSS
ncbi:AAA family ATPase [Deinococcus hohokamensis]|uniref:AAA family ATPase n=1 Tax=Deinococcus hohokamensis TaxID=309883 RepID=A0ABV9IAB7_9DEIO